MRPGAEGERSDWRRIPAARVSRHCLFRHLIGIIIHREGAPVQFTDAVFTIGQRGKVGYDDAP